MNTFDFSAVTAEPAELPARTSGKERKYKENPFRNFVKDSWDTKTGRAVTLPKVQVKDAEYLIRQAAADLGLGIRIVRVNPSSGTQMTADAFEKAANNKNVKIQFQAQPKRKYSARTPKNEVELNQPETGTAPEPEASETPAS